MRQVDKQRVTVTLHARLPSMDAGDKLLQLLESQPGVRRVRIEPLG